MVMQKLLLCPVDLHLRLRSHGAVSSPLAPVNLSVVEAAEYLSSKLAYRGWLMVLRQSLRTRLFYDDGLGLDTVFIKLPNAKVRSYGGD